MTIFEAYNNTKKKLSAAGIDDAVFEAKQIIRHVTGLTSAQILAQYNNSLTEFQQSILTVTVKQRLIRYPLQYIFGEWDFYGRTFKVGPGVLVPRADTETLIDKAVEYLKNIQNPIVLDLCAGSGCIGITLACEVPQARVIMVEKYEEAMRYLKENIERNGANNAKAVLGDVFEGAGKQTGIDLIISNPPYISENEMETISPETKFEPETALYGGEDGLVFYRAIVSEYLGALKPGGMAAFEVGFDQSQAVCELMAAAGLVDIKAKKDLNGIDRAVFGIKI